MCTGSHTIIETYCTLFARADVAESIYSIPEEVEELISHEIILQVGNQELRLFGTMGIDSVIEVLSQAKELAEERWRSFYSEEDRFTTVV